MRARWSKIVATCIGFLLLSGLYNIYVIETHTLAPKNYAWYHPLFGVKFLLAFAIFGIASLLSGKTPAADKLRQNARFWMNLNIVLAVLVVCISGFLRTAEKTPKIADQPAIQQPAEK
jgi:putative copper export protein